MCSRGKQSPHKLNRGMTCFFVTLEGDQVIVSIYQRQTPCRKMIKKKYRENKEKFDLKRYFFEQSLPRVPHKRETSAKSFVRGGECAQRSQGTPPVCLLRAKYKCCICFPLTIFVSKLIQVEQITNLP